MTPRSARLDERFASGVLDTDVWFPYYLPHWSSREGSRATYEVDEGRLRLSIPRDQGLWCPDTHEEPIRVSCIQSGTLDGQQPFRSGLSVVEHQEPFRGCTPRYGEVGITMRGEVTARSMFAFWLSGIEDSPERSGEICVAEVFGSSLDRSSAEVGIGIHAFGDPDLEEDFTTERHSLDVSAFHDYVVTWLPGSVEVTIDGHVVRKLSQAPDYPVQLMLGVFDFPDRAVSRMVPVPVMEVKRVWVRPV